MEKKKTTRRWRDYETAKAAIADRVARSGKDGAEAARMYEREVKRLCKRLGV